MRDDQPKQNIPADLPSSKQSKNFVKSICRSIFISLLIVINSQTESLPKSIQDVAKEYVQNISDQKIYVWPTKSTSTEIVTKEKIDIVSLVEEYERSRHNSNFTIGKFPDSLISIFYGHDINTNPENYLENSTSFPIIKKLTRNYKKSPDGCTAYFSTSRDTWISSAAIYIEPQKNDRFNLDFTSNCLNAALDFINGFPTPGNYFDLNSMPEPPVRKLIMDALEKCSRDPTGSGIPAEITMDGIMPLPTAACLIKNIVN